LSKSQRDRNEQEEEEEEEEEEEDVEQSSRLNREQYLEQYHVRTLHICNNLLGSS